MTLRQLCPAALSLFAVPVFLRAQAAVEYAVKSAGSAAFANGGSSGSSIAGCYVDSNLLSCLSHSYPRTTIVAAVLICLFVIRWLAGHAGYGNH